jgi:nicotinamide mononucleotide transporter
VRPVSLGEALAAVAAVWAGVSPVEAVAAVLGLVYLLLVIGQHRGAWLAALASTALYLYVFYGARLYMQAALQVYYIAVALYAWHAWRRRPGGGELPVSRASWRAQAAGLAAVLAVSAASAAWLARETGSADPFLDSLTTWASVFTTWLVARKKIENWPWWLVVDALIVVLCWRGRLYASMILYGLYLGLVLMGWRSWYLDMQRQSRTPETAA